MKKTKHYVPLLKPFLQIGHKFLKFISMEIEIERAAEAVGLGC